MKVETLAKSIYFHMWDMGFPYLLTFFSLKNESIAKFLWNYVVLMQHDFSETALTSVWFVVFFFTTPGTLWGGFREFQLSETGGDGLSCLGT